jgi:hypothetical protein
MYGVVDLADTTAVKEEVSHQLATFRRLVGEPPTHIDSHQHVHLRDPARSVLVDVARKLGVPLRHCSNEIRYCGDFYGQTAESAPLLESIRVENLIQILKSLPVGITELACHPGAGADLDTMYRYERDQEVSVLCDSQVRAAINRLGIKLCSFGEAPICSMEAKHW